MRVFHHYNKTTPVHSYNDSGMEWVVFSGQHSTQRFPMSEFKRMRDAVDFYCRINGITDTGGEA